MIINYLNIICLTAWWGGWVGCFASPCFLRRLGGLGFGIVGDRFARVFSLFRLTLRLPQRPLPRCPPSKGQNEATRTKERSGEQGDCSGWWEREEKQGDGWERRINLCYVNLPIITARPQQPVNPSFIFSYCSTTLLMRSHNSQANKICTFPWVKEVTTRSTAILRVKEPRTASYNAKGTSTRWPLRITLGSKRISIEPIPAPFINVTAHVVESPLISSLVTYGMCCIGVATIPANSIKIGVTAIRICKVAVIKSGCCACSIGTLPLRFSGQTITCATWILANTTTHVIPPTSTFFPASPSCCAATSRKRIT